MIAVRDPHLRRGAGSVLLAVGTAAAIFALTAPGGGSSGARTVELGPGVRTLALDLPAARVRVTAGDRATVRLSGHVEASTSGGTATVRCAAGERCDGAAVDVRLPRAAGVRGTVGAGSVSVSGVSGAIALRGRTAKLSALDVKPPSIAMATESGDIHISLAAVARTVDARTASSPISVSVPYAYRSDGYRLHLRTTGHRDLDITRSDRADAPIVRALSETGDLLITQRYPNMS